MSTLSVEQFRDLGVTIYTVAVYTQTGFLIRNVRALYRRRKPIFVLSTALCAFGLAAAISSYFYSSKWIDYRLTCYRRLPLNASFHFLSLTCSDLIHLYKMRVVNTGIERRIFTAIGMVFFMFRLGASATNAVLSSSSLTPAGTCATTFDPRANTLLNVSITLNNVVLGGMFVFPLIRHMSRMSSVQQPSSSNKLSQGSGTALENGAAKTAKAPAPKPKGPQSLIPKLVNAGLKWAILSSLVSTVTYSLIASNILGALTGMLVYIDWIFMTLCATEMLLEKPSKGEPGGDTSGSASQSGSALASKQAINKSTALSTKDFN